MKTNSKLIAFALALALGTGGSLAVAQQTAPKATAPSPNLKTAAPPPIQYGGTVHSTASGTASPTAGLRRGGASTEQPNMARAYISLQEAKRALEDATPDKGGFREKAIAEIEQAIKDVGAGVEYARTHSEETRGPRSTAPRGSAGNRGVTTTSGSSAFGGVAPGGVAPGGVAPSGITPGQK